MAGSASNRHRLAKVAGPSLVLATVTAVNFAGIWIPAPWRDEAATWYSTQRTDAELWSMLGHADAVHGIYYFIIGWWSLAFGDSALSLRSFSALGVGVGAALVTVLARKVFGTRGAVPAGLIYGVLPPITWAAAQARSYAWVAALAIAVVIAFWEASTNSTWYRWVGYALLAAFVAYFFLYLALIPIAMLVAVHWLDHQARAPAVASSIVAAGLAVPIFVTAARQSAQVGWLANVPINASSVLLEPLWGGQWLAQATGSAVLIMLCVAGAKAWQQPESRRGLAMLVGWLVVPGTVLLAAHPIKPLFHPRYVILCVPAVAVLTPLLTGRLRRRWQQWAVGALIVATMTPSFLAARDARHAGLAPTSVIAYLDANYRPGDAVYLYGKDVGGLRWAFPAVVTRFRSVGLKPTGWQDQLIYQPSFAAAGIGTTLTDIDRLWVIGDRGEFGTSLSDFSHLGFTQRTWYIGDDRFHTVAVLMQRTSPR